MNIAEQVIEHITKQLMSGENKELTPDTNLIDEGVLDSTAMMEMVLWLEEEYTFSIKIEDMTPEKFGTVSNMVEYIQENSPRCKEEA